MSREEFVTSCNGIRHFINKSLNLSRADKISGFELSEHLLDSAVYNTYVEAVGNKSDTLYLRIKQSLRK